MRTVRFYDMVADCIENGAETTRQITHDLHLEFPEDFDLNDVFPTLNDKTGCDICSFRYEYLT